ncbi:MAG: FkbM family methyltransferase [Rubrivivax sp.]|nr:MAG: FkbM family methyltransferase [Rubrivivax sp.]
MSFKVVIDGVFFQIGRSGIARVWTQLLQQWVDNGFARQVVVIDRARSMPRLPGITYVDAPAFAYGDHDRRLVQAICDQVQAQVFISTYYTLPVSTPSLMMVHDLIPELLGWDLSEPMWQQKQQAMAYATRFVSVSHNTAKDLKAYLKRPDLPVDVAQNGCDFQPAGAQAVQDFRERQGLVKPYFLLSGSRSDYKNAVLFFRAFALLGDQRAEYTILCTGGGAVEPELLALAGPADVRVGILSDQDMVCAYSGAQALAYPSTYEGFGLPVLEAMACGCPVISTNAASLPEVGGDAPLYVNLGAHEAEQLHAHLLAVRQPAVRAAMVAKGLRQAGLFRWDQMAQQIQAALQTTVNEANTQLHRPSLDKPAMQKLHPTDQWITYDHCAIALPADHLLPHYQQQHKFYDHFLPHLAKALPQGSVAIDVGANCGDTVAAMFDTNPTLSYICVEPDQGFYAYLAHNSALIRQSHPQADLRLVQSLVGKQGTSAVLTGGGGSKRALAVSGEDDPALQGASVHRSISLDDIATAQLGDQLQRISLLKSDVDGFDHDVLASAARVLDQVKPVLFFECQATDEAQLAAYKACLSSLALQGYTRFWLFDNYGNPMLSTGDAQAVNQLFDYIWRQACQGATRTMYYVDILATHEGNAALAETAVQSYLAAMAAR